MDTKTDSQWDRQRGEGKIGAIIGWLIFLAICYAAWQLVPVYFNNYAFRDKMIEVARRHPGLPQGKDQAILDALVKEQRERGLQDYFDADDIKIQTDASRRRIYLKYSREVEVLPNYKRKIDFVNDVEMPLL
jgi:hypothetical protein